MTQENGLAVRDTSAAMVEQVVITGDLAKLSPEDRVAYYRRLCDSLGLNPWSKPFDYLHLNNKLVLYAKKDATDQLRKIHNVSVSIVSRERVDDVYVVTARATLPSGRADESIGAVSIGGLKGDALGNALMKAESKSKRRVTLSIVGLGMLDESEVETIPDAQRVTVEDVPVQPERIAAPIKMPVNAATGRPYTEQEMRFRYRELYDRLQGLGSRRPQIRADAPIGDVVTEARQVHAEIQELEAQIPMAVS